MTRSMKTASRVMRLLAVTTTAAGALLPASLSHAAGENLQLLTVTRDGPGHDSPYGLHISRSDCESTEIFTFPYTASSLAGVQAIQVWLSEGQNCALEEERGANGGCTQIGDDITNVDAMGSIELTSAEIAAAVAGVDNCIDSRTNSNPHITTLYFLLIRSSGVDVDEADVRVHESTEVDLLGPGTPSGLVFKAADSAVLAEFETSDATADAKGFQLYCNPRPAADPEDADSQGNAVGGGGAAAGGASGTGGASGGAGPASGGAGGASGGAGAASGGSGGASGGAGGSATGGTGGTGGSGSVDCDEGAMVAGDPPPSGYECGDVIDGATGTVSGLTNGTTYAFAIAGVDQLDNPGVLSDISCVTPVNVDDFFENYREAGGKGGCVGGCETAARGPTPGALGVLGVLGLVGVLRRRRRARLTRAPRALWLAPTVLLPWMADVRADAQSLEDNNWRQSSRPRNPPADTQFAFEVRMAPYWPQIDDEPGLSGTPYESTFDNDPQFYFGLEFDWLPARIPYVGMLGAGFGWGYTSASTAALIADCEVTATEDCVSEDQTSLDIHPMHLSVVLRGDELMRRTGVPLVPYGKFGFGFAYWNAATTAGTSSTGSGASEVMGEDVTTGLHAALGLQFALNWLDGRSEGAMHATTGIAHAYAFAEWFNQILNGFGSGEQMYVGTSTIVGGLSLDF